MTSPAAASLAAPISSNFTTHSDRSAAFMAAAQFLLRALSTGRKIDAGVMRGAMEQAFGGSDSEGLSLVLERCL